MLRFAIPYSLNKKLFDAWDYEMQITPDPQDWVCMLDGDTAFLTPDFGHQIQRYIDLYPDTGLFTCYASRCHYKVQIKKGTQINNTDILYHKTMAEKARSELDGRIKEINRNVAGHLIVIRKKTWLKIREEVKNNTTSKKILGIDTKISSAVLKAGLKIRLMRGMYIFHYLRMTEGIEYTKHLK